VPELTGAEAEEAIALAKAVWEFVLARLPVEVQVGESED